MENLILEIFRVVLKLEDVDKASLVYGETSGWDSLKHMEIIFSLEEEFDVEFSKEDVEQMRSYSKICSLVSRKLA